jgi:hypothetical protein
MLSRRFFAFALLSIIACPARAADAPLTLQQQLVQEPVADLAKAARARGAAAREAVLVFQPFLPCARCHDDDTGTQLGPEIAKGMSKLLAPPAKEPAEPAKPTAHTDRQLEGWTVRVDDRLLKGPDEALGTRALRFLENKLSDIKAVVPEDKLKKLQAVTIVLDLTHGKLGPMQYHPDGGWLKANGYSPDLAKCVHIPRAADLPTKRNINEQPWVILHELAHAYHDQVLGFDEPRIKEAYEKYKKGGHGEKALLYNGKRVKHYALTNHKEFFAEMTEAYFGVNDFFPFNRAELKESEPEIFTLLSDIWESPPKQETKNGGRKGKDQR